MSEINIANLSPDSIQQAIAVVDKLLKIGKSLAFLTPTTLDDTVIDTVQKVLDSVKPFVSEAWFADLWNMLVSLFKHDPKAALEAIKAALTK